MVLTKRLPATLAAELAVPQDRSLLLWDPQLLLLLLLQYSMGGCLYMLQQHPLPQHQQLRRLQQLLAQGCGTRGPVRAQQAKAVVQLLAHQQHVWQHSQHQQEQLLLLGSSCHPGGH
jgi:hypothetical protein